MQLFEDTSPKETTKAVIGQSRIGRLCKQSEPEAKPEAGKKSADMDPLEEKQDNPTPKVFGRNLAQLDKDGRPKPVLVMLQKLYAKGLSTKGIFRQGANMTKVKELKKQIDSTGDTSCLADATIINVGALLKDFLRSLPDPLLTSHLFPLWEASLESDDPIQTIKR